VSRATIIIIQTIRPAHRDHVPLAASQCGDLTSTPVLSFIIPSIAPCVNNVRRHVRPHSNITSTHLLYILYIPSLTLYPKPTLHKLLHTIISHLASQRNTTSKHQTRKAKKKNVPRIQKHKPHRHRQASRARPRLRSREKRPRRLGFQYVLSPVPKSTNSSQRLYTSC
jgi:hypothetical protein